MCCSCAMTASRVTPPTDEEGANVEGAEEAGGAAIYVCGSVEAGPHSVLR